MPLIRLRRREADATPRISHSDARRLDLGRRGIADLLAPAAVVPAPDALQIDGDYARDLYLSGLPRGVGDGWLGQLVGFEEPLVLSQHVTPLDSGAMTHELGNRLNELEASRRLAERAGQMPMAERSLPLEDTERVQEQLTRGEERLFAVGHYLQVSAPSRRLLDDSTARLERVLGALQLHSRVARFAQSDAFRAFLPECRDPLGHTQTFTTSALATSFPFDAGTLSTPGGVLCGLAKQSLVIFDPFDPGLDNANTAVIATSGAGKSYFVKLLALRNLEEGVEVTMIDRDGEYGRLCDAVGGQRVRLATSGGAAINPFDLPRPGADEPPGAARNPVAEAVDAPLALLELMLADPGGRLTAGERAILDRALYDAYATAGISPGDPASWARPAAILGDLATRLAALPGETPALLALRLGSCVAGSLAALFGRPTDVDLDNRLVVFDLQRLDGRLQPLAIQVVAAHVWGHIRQSRRPRLLIANEAWKLLQHPAGAEFHAGLSRRARKYWLGVVTVVHGAEILLGSPAGRAVLGTAAAKLVLKQGEAGIDAATATFGVTEAERRYLLGADKGEGLFLARGGRVPLRVVASPAEHTLITTAPRELAALASGDAESILDGRSAAPGSAMADVNGGAQ